MPLQISGTGIEIETLAESKAALEISLQAPGAFGPDFDIGSDTPEGQIVGVFAERLIVIQQGIKEVAECLNPNSAAGLCLDNILALSGTARLGATASTIAGTATGTPATLIPEGSIVRFNPGGSLESDWATTADATIGGGGTIAVTVIASTLGEVQASISTDWTIQTAVAGWSAFESIAAVDLGREIETDPAARTRRDLTLATLGAGTPPSTIANAFEIADVESVFFFQNTTDATNGDGLPPHTFEVLIQGGADADIAQFILENSPNGVSSFGSDGPHVATIPANGQAFNVYFSRPSPIPITLRITIETTGAEGTYPADGDALAIAAALSRGQAHTIGEDVIPVAFIGAIATAITLNVLPPYRSIVVEVDDGGGLQLTPITIAPRDYATFDISAITVVKV